MTPYYHDPQANITIYCGDVLDVLNAVDLRPCRTILTDPPYFRWGAGQEIARGFRPYDVAEDAAWLADVLAWYRQWLPALWQMAEYSNGRAWIFSHLVYLPALCRIAHELAWPLRRLLLHPTCDHALTLFGQGVGIEAFDLDSTYGGFGVQPHMFQVVLMELIGASGDGTVLDPFMGSGSTLVAAKRAGLPAIGIDIEESRCAEAVKALEAA